MQINQFRILLKCRLCLRRFGPEHLYFQLDPDEAEGQYDLSEAFTAGTPWAIWQRTTAKCVFPF